MINSKLLNKDLGWWFKYQEIKQITTKNKKEKSLETIINYSKMNNLMKSVGLILLLAYVKSGKFKT